MLSSLLGSAKRGHQTTRALSNTTDGQDARSRRFVRLSDRQDRLEPSTELNGNGSVEEGQVADGQWEEDDGDIEEEEDDDEDDEAAPLLPIFSAAHLGISCCSVSDLRSQL